MSTLSTMSNFSTESQIGSGQDPRPCLPGILALLQSSDSREEPNHGSSTDGKGWGTAAPEFGCDPPTGIIKRTNDNGGKKGASTPNTCTTTAPLPLSSIQYLHVMQILYTE